MPRYLAVLGKPRYLGIFGLEDESVPLSKGDRIMVSSPRGEEVALVLGVISPEKEEELRVMRSNQDMGDGVRSEPLVMDLEFISPLEDQSGLPTPEEDESALRRARDILSSHCLPMKIIDAEYLPNRNKLFFYFTAEQRVDFRALVKDLAKEFRTRIELRQVGVRDEAKIIRGLAPCGRPCCCSYWLHQFAPICIKMVKEQNLALNPTKISGLCGRLMCCMSFEHRAYRELWEHLPNPGSKVKTPKGNYVIVGVDLKRSAVRCSFPGGPELLVPVHLFDQFKETVMRGEDWVPPVSAEEPHCGACSLQFGDLPGSMEVRREEPKEVQEDAPVDQVPKGSSRRRRRRKKPKGTDRVEADSSESEAEVPSGHPKEEPKAEGERKPSGKRRWRGRRNRKKPAGEGEAS
ncbi:PSP1 domain-containing protein [Thermanaerovibrio acidaminovorans]|uniref:PSP1 domain-containing protein n=1 Tax=Thermanaerovibrio acidaminovorans TaxID=81462 RepID=UPI002490E98F|nr:regulatory iron-sulfur-containing complex subunit RicT [Thermanaerovibrio acidaminovorans]